MSRAVATSTGLNGYRKSSASLTIINKALRETPWEDISEEKNDLYKANFQANRKHYAVVHRKYSIGWREGFFNNILITKPFSEYGLKGEVLEKYFEEHDLVVFSQTGKENVYQALYRDDQERKNYKENIYAHLENIYEKNGAVYFLFKKENSDMLLKFLDEKTFFLTCELQLTPTIDKIDQQLLLMPTLAALKATLGEMIGTECMVNVPRVAAANDAMNHSFNVMTYRPWILEGSETLRKKVESNLDLWGHSGLWEYTTYNKYQSDLPKAEEELGRFYEKNFALPPAKTRPLAHTAISQALIAGFDHGHLRDVSYDINKKILNGTVTTEDLDKINTGKLAEEKSDPNDERDDNLLLFAIAQPRVLTMLLDRGANPNHQNWFGKTPLMYAAQFNQLETAQILLEHGARTEPYTVKTFGSCFQRSHLTALHYAVRYGSMELIKLLLRHNAPTFAKDSEENTPLSYLTKFDNNNLTPAQREELKTLLQPPTEDQKRAHSKKENLAAEKLYAEKKLPEAYAALKKALMLDPSNEAAMANLALVALRLDRLGESAAISSQVINSTKSDDLKANAFFNLGLVCEKPRERTIQYEGKYYCDYDYVNNKKVDLGALSSFLSAYQLKPSKARLAKILEAMHTRRYQNRNSHCVFNDGRSGIRAVHFNEVYWYFLMDANKSVPFTEVSGQYSNGVQPLPIKEKETIPLNDELKMERWRMDQGYGVPTYMGDMICAPELLKAYPAETKVAALFLSPNSHNAREGCSSAEKEEFTKLTVKLANATPVILYFYGRNTEFVVEGDLSKVQAIYIHGNSRVTLPSVSGVEVVKKEDRSCSPTPEALSHSIRGWSGLPTTSITVIGGKESITLTDRMIEENRIKAP